MRTKKNYNDIRDYANESTRLLKAEGLSLSGIKSLQDYLRAANLHAFRPEDDYQPSTAEYVKIAKALAQLLAALGAAQPPEANIQIEDY